jgi:hypothetical protein
VHHARQVPLRIDLLAPTVVKAGQAFVMPDLGKHRLDRANALAAKNWDLTPIYRGRLLLRRTIPVTPMQESCQQ